MTTGLDDLLNGADTGFDGPDGPGAVVGVVADGRLAGVATCGLASLEHRAPIDARTVFHVASVSKQFTAYAVALLADEDRLGLDDPVGAHLEWFPFPDVTVRQLVHHTSGLRDQWVLTVLSGRRIEDVITTEDIRSLIGRQRELNFPPGAQFSYSNSGYTLLGEIVRAVTGRTLGEYCAERVFGPLGMTRTRFVDDHHDVVPGRADSYARRPDGGYARIALSYSNSGATSLNTTVEDLARWAVRLMVPDARRLVDQRVTLPGGAELNYAMGVRVGDYRGYAALAHSGADAGYRSHLLVLPDRRAAAIVLSNRADAEAMRLAQRAVDLVLPDPPEAPTPNEMRRMTGTYLDDDGDAIVELATDDERLARIEAVPGGVLLHPDHGGPRFCRRLEEFDGWVADGGCAGTFYSAELAIVVELEAVDGVLRLRHTGWGTVELRPMGPDLFLATLPFLVGIGGLDVVVRLAPDRSEFRLGNPQARRIRFTRLV